MLSLGIDASLAFCTASASAGLPSGSPPPSLAATVIARASLVNSLPRRASTIAFLCLIPAHLECPAMGWESRRMVPDDRAARARAYESARPEIAALVPPGARRVLDLGCATGALAAALKARGPVEVVGVERDPGYAAEAERRCDRVVVADVEALAPRAEVELGRFD